MQGEALTRDAEATDDVTTPYNSRRFWLAVLGIGALCELVLCAALHASITGLIFNDADDHMRLQEVRDWIAGQSWFDVTQYRMNPPTGMLMHWSRLLDVPLAAVIVALRPLTGQHAAEIAACVIVPMLTLGLCMTFVAAIVRRQVGPWFALLAIPACAFNIGTFYALRPMRIDHHGWQIVAGLAIVWALIGRPSARRSAIAGLSAAFWMHVSLEGLVFTALAAAWFGLRWIVRPDRESYRLPVFLSSLAGSSLVFFTIAHGGALFDRTFCDAISPVHITVFALAAIGVTLTVRCGPGSIMLRALSLGLTASLCGALYRLWAPQCLGGPFTTMSPLVYRLWYLHVKEGLPLWDVPLHDTLLWLPFPAIGILGALFAWWHTRKNAEHDLQLDYLALMMAATAVALTLERAGAFANILAIPGALHLLRAVRQRTARSPAVAMRALWTALALLLLAPITSPLLSLLSSPKGAESPSSEAYEAAVAQCLSSANMARLDSLPPALVMTTLNTGPNLLTGTHHRVIASGYHRNNGAIGDVLLFFKARENVAHAIAQRRHLNYVFLCPPKDQMKDQQEASPDSLTVRLAQNHPPAWLRPVALPGLTQGSLYAVVR
jgi:hypothetical protein